MSNLQPFLRSVPRVLADFILPHHCLVCGEASGASQVCRDCAADLPFLSGPACRICAVPTLTGEICGRCLRTLPAFDATRAVLAYEFPVDRLVQALKYRHRLSVSSYFTGLLARLGRPTDVDVVLPMPLHARRLCERGFNQAVELARPLARAWELPMLLDGVRRKTDGASQASLPWRLRNANMRDAFACSVDLDGRSVLVIDDVMTTGATLEALARTLKQRGANRVENLVLARTLPPA